MVDPDLQLYFTATTTQDLGRYRTGGSGFNFFATLQRPISVGEIKLNSSDPLDFPSIDPKYFINDEKEKDLKTLIKGLRINREIASQEPVSSLLKGEIGPSAHAKSDEEIGDFIRSHCTTLYHPAGTCKMGIDASSVVSPSLELYGVDNLRVCDASIMPKIISGNLQATVIMTAERCARFMGIN